MHAAATNGNVDMLKRLVEAQADVNEVRRGWLGVERLSSVEVACLHPTDLLAPFGRLPWSYYGLVAESSRFCCAFCHLALSFVPSVERNRLAAWTF